MAIGTTPSDTISASVDPDGAGEIFEAMDHASSMNVKVGKDNAFRTCAGLKSHARTRGSNPFE